MFQVTINGMKYVPEKDSLNKKAGKMAAATVCLQNLGLLPRDFNNPV